MSKHKDQYINQNTSQNLTQLGLNEEEKYDSMKSKFNRTSSELNFQQQEMNETTYIESKRQRPKIEEDKKTENPTEQHLGNLESNDYEKKLDKCPPNFKRAKTHGFANKVKQPDFTEKKQDLMDDTPALCEC